MRLLSVIVLSLAASMLPAAQAQERAELPSAVLDLTTKFVPQHLTVTGDLIYVPAEQAMDPATGRPILGFCVLAHDADGTTWLLSFEVDVSRGYVSQYWATTSDPRIRDRETMLDRTEAKAVAREFAATHFPRPLEELELESVLDPPLSPVAGLPTFSFYWRGKRGNVLTGDSVSVSVLASTGDVVSYRSRPALDFTEEDVAISEERAIADVRDLVREMGLKSLNDVTFRATLWLSHPQTEGEGPAWQVVAIRPPLRAEGGFTIHRRLLRVVDARTGAIVASREPLFSETAFFGTDRSEEE